jgi:hypothetical protein
MHDGIFKEGNAIKRLAAHRSRLLTKAHSSLLTARSIKMARGSQLTAHDKTKGLTAHRSRLLTRAHRSQLTALILTSQSSKFLKKSRSKKKN